ncbi:MAG: hypothetical protein AMS19_13385 [Gemmatimonas sp. SG8_23]|nr:MAG: hypothetical protein AMS19_13385 [Gemmatimonas sp. SG8_23]
MLLLVLDSRTERRSSVMTTSAETNRNECARASILAAAVGLLLVLGLRAIGKIPGDWLGWLLQCWGMA